MIRTEHGAPARRVPDRTKGKIALDMDHPADRRQVLSEHPSRRLVQQLVTGADQEILGAGLIKDLFRIFDSLCKRLFDIDMTSRFQCRSCKRRMGGRRRTDMHDVRSYSSQKLFGCAVALDLRHNASHRSLSGIRGICHRDQLGAGASQDRTGMMLGMAAGTKESDMEKV